MIFAVLLRGTVDSLRHSGDNARASLVLKEAFGSLE